MIGYTLMGLAVLFVVLVVAVVVGVVVLLTRSRGRQDQGSTDGRASSK